MSQIRRLNLRLTPVQRNALNNALDNLETAATTVYRPVLVDWREIPAEKRAEILDRAPLLARLIRLAREIHERIGNV